MPKLVFPTCRSMQSWVDFILPAKRADHPGHGGGFRFEAVTELCRPPSGSAQPSTPTEQFSLDLCIGKDTRLCAMASTRLAALHVTTRTASKGLGRNKALQGVLKQPSMQIDLKGDVLGGAKDDSFVIRWLPQNREVVTMITEIVLWRLPEGMSREDATAKYRLSVPTWQANPDLIHKAFLFDEASRRGGGVYLWKNLEAARQGHGPAFQERIRSIFGAAPEFQYFETPIVIDNTAKQVIDEVA